MNIDIFSSSAYDAVMKWLSDSSLGSIADAVTIDLNSQQEMDRGIPSILKRHHQITYKRSVSYSDICGTAA